MPGRPTRAASLRGHDPGAARPGGSAQRPGAGRRRLRWRRRRFLGRLGVDDGGRPRERGPARRRLHRDRGGRRRARRPSTRRASSPPPTTRPTRRPAATTTRRRSQAGTFYTEPPRLGEAVHLLEHGAVIGWTNGLSDADLEAVEEEFNEIFKDGYYQLAVVENPDLEVPFALSAWGALQKCDEVDTAAIRAVRRGVVRVAEDGRGRARLPGRRAHAAELLSRCRSAAGRGTRARASRRARAAGRPRARRCGPPRAAPPRPWRGVTMSGSVVQRRRRAGRRPRPARSSSRRPSSSPPKTTCGRRG